MSNSQAGQDLFVLYSTNYKKNGIFVEIGSCHYKKMSNSFILEDQYNWSGVMIEYEKKYLNDYQTYRKKSTHYISDATLLDYKEIFKNFPSNLDYLQIDLEVSNQSTIKCLEKLNDEVLNHYKFGVVTFEHDIYSGDYFNTKIRSREILKNLGYELIFPDVKNEGYPFEDWYLHPSLIDEKNIKKLQTNESLEWSDIIKKFT